MTYNIYTPLGLCTLPELLARAADISSGRKKVDKVVDSFMAAVTEYPTQFVPSKAASRRAPRRALTPDAQFAKWQHSKHSMMFTQDSGPTVKQLYADRVKSSMPISRIAKKYGITQSVVRIKLFTMPKQYWQELREVKGEILRKNFKR